MKIKPFFDDATWTLSYVVYEGADAVVIDPVLDFEPRAVATSTRGVDAISAFLREQDLTLHYVLETHAHADHLSGAQLLKERFGAKIGIGKGITAVQQTFAALFHLGEDFPTDGRQFDRLLEDGDVLRAGALEIRTLATPGHTPACSSYVIGDAVFTGDVLFMPDSGTGRCDFPAGSAADQYDSVVRKLYALPDHTRVLVGHDYQPGGRALAFETTIGESKRANQMLPADTGQADFIARREARDKTLLPPNLLFQSIQVNIDAGALPPAESDGRHYLKLPLNVLQ